MNFRTLENLQDKYDCLICLDFLEDPVTTRCGHNRRACLSLFWNDLKHIFRCSVCQAGTSPTSDDLILKKGSKNIGQLTQLYYFCEADRSVAGLVLAWSCTVRLELLANESRVFCHPLLSIGKTNACCNT